MARQLFSSNIKRAITPTVVARPKIENSKCSSGAEVSNTKIYQILNTSERLSNSNVISSRSPEEGATETSLSILNAFGISVVEEIENADYTLLDGAGLEQKKLETLEKTADYNPNRKQTKKFKTLKNKKVKLSKNFSQIADNPIYELDECLPDSIKVEIKKLPNTIEIANDFIDFSPNQLITRIT